jgi:hypothetical protein
MLLAALLKKRLALRDLNKPIAARVTTAMSRAASEYSTREALRFVRNYFVRTRRS